MEAAEKCLAKHLGTKSTLNCTNEQNGPGLEEVGEDKNIRVLASRPQELGHDVITMFSYNNKSFVCTGVHFC
jgi:hypothetical protein